MYYSFYIGSFLYYARSAKCPENTCMYFLVTCMLHTYVTYIFFVPGLTNHKMSVSKHAWCTNEAGFDGRSLLLNKWMEDMQKLFVTSVG